MLKQTKNYHSLYTIIQNKNEKIITSLANHKHSAEFSLMEYNWYICRSIRLQIS